MSQNELEEHRRYLADQRKWQAYRDALKEVMRPTDIVLDLGTGSGMLGHLACDAGAGSVVAVDRGDIIGLARRIAERSGYSDRISHVQKMSTELVLDPPADVVVCDQIGGLVHDAGILRYYADARRRLLSPTGRFVPASFSVLLGPVTFPRAREAIEFWASAPSGLDVTPAREHAVNTEWKYNIETDDLTPLAPGQELARFASDHDGPITGEIEFEVRQPGRFDGFIGWFVADMSPSVTMTNDPFSPDRLDRWCNFLPVDEPVDVEPGQTIRLGLDIRPRLKITSWSTEVCRDGSPAVTARHSTFNGAFLTGDTIGTLRRNQPVVDSSRVALARTVLGLADGGHSRTDIVRVLQDHIGTAVVSQEHLERFVRRVLRAAR